MVTLWTFTDKWVPFFSVHSHDTTSCKFIRLSKLKRSLLLILLTFPIHYLVYFLLVRSPSLLHLHNIYWEKFADFFGSRDLWSFRGASGGLPIFLVRGTCGPFVVLPGSFYWYCFYGNVVENSAKKNVFALSFSTVIYNNLHCNKLTEYNFKFTDSNKVNM